MGGGSGGADAADVKGAAEVEAEANRRAAQAELWANRADQYGPMGTSTWENSMVDANTGRPIKITNSGAWIFADEGNSEVGDLPPIPDPNDFPGDPVGLAHAREAWQRNFDANNAASSANIDAVNSWDQTTTLSPQWQEILEERQGLISDKTGYQAGVVADWGANPNDFNDIG